MSFIFISFFHSSFTLISGRCSFNQKKKVKKLKEKHRKKTTSYCRQRRCFSSCVCCRCFVPAPNTHTHTHTSGSRKYTVIREAQVNILVLEIFTQIHCLPFQLDFTWKKFYIHTFWHSNTHTHTSHLHMCSSTSSSSRSSVGGATVCVKLGFGFCLLPFLHSRFIFRHDFHSMPGTNRLPNV